jgi:nucleoside-diphosphate-sugar epimerase
MLAAGWTVTIYHTGAHEHDFSGPVEHIHGDARELANLERDLGGRTWDYAVSNGGRVRYTSQALAGKVKRFVAVSGYSIYLNAPTKHEDFGLAVPVPEDAPTVETKEQHEWGYLISLGEKTVMKHHAEGGFGATIFRYPKVYGPYAPGPWEWFFVKRILDGRTRVALEGDGLMIPQRGYADNLAYAIFLALQSEAASGQIYNGGDARSLSVKQVASVIANEMGHTWQTVGVPVSESPCGNPMAPRTSVLFDMAKLMRDTGYRDLVPVEEATRRTVRWLIEHQPGPEDLSAFGPHIFDYEREDEIMDRYLAVATNAGAGVWRARH